MARKLKSPTTIETFALQNFKSGQFFYTDRKDKDMTAWANHYNVKIRTERMIAIDSPKHEKIERIVKVTIL
ncbi:MAG: hypothetical protein PF487_09035 [Bacteroidales bacterium]|jgi:hypothetical protein|nr:hypothetical protein [Bacteroidales bacterium]